MLLFSKAMEIRNNISGIMDWLDMCLVSILTEPCIHAKELGCCKFLKVGSFTIEVIG